MASPVALSAAQRLQQQHSQLASNAASDPAPMTEDPFPPTLLAATAPAPRSVAKLDIQDADSFPSLGGAVSGAKPTGSLWGSQRATPAAVTAPRSGTPDDSSRASVTTATVSLPTSDIHVQALASQAFLDGLGRSRTREPEPKSLGEVMKLLMRKHPVVRIEASTSRNVTTFIIKASGPESEEEVQSVKRELVARLSKKVTVEVGIPAGLRAFIIGAKGRTLKSITDSTGAQIQVPPRDPEAPETNGDADEGPLIPISISGDSSAVAAARAKILAIVAEKASKLVVKLETISKEFWPLLAGPKGARMLALVEEADAKDTVSVFVPRAFEKRAVASDEEEVVQEKKESFVTVTGEREAVARVVAAIEALHAELKRTSKTISLSVNKRQHRFLVGAAADELLAECGCSVELPPIDDANDNVTIRGPQAELVKALGFVMDKANASPVETLDLSTAHARNPDVALYTTQLVRYITRRSKFRKLSEDNSVSVYLPRAAAIAAGSPLIEIVGKDAAGVEGARLEIISIVRTLPPANFTTVKVDSLIHRHLIGKKGSRIKAFEEKRGVQVVFPPDGEDRSDILLVYTDKGKAEDVLAEVRTEILQLAKEAADIKSITITIPAQYHGNIIGQNGTTLNAVIGEDRLVNVSFGNKTKSAETGEDTVVIRGPSEEVARVKAQIERIAEEARDTAIINAYTVEFEIETTSVRHIVGKAGTGVNRLREELGVRIDFVELAAPEANGKGKAPVAKSKVTIKGRKENVEEAKKRISSQGEKIADETTLIIPLPASFDRGSLIGKQGIYLKRLETTYDVRINFPKDRKNADASEAADSRTGASEISIRGARKGAEGAKKELVDLMEYEKENGNVVVFTVSTKSLPRILGKGGVSINAIKEETNVQLDIDQGKNESDTATVTLRGTKTGTQKAKSLVLAIAKEVDDESVLTLSVPREFHTTLIGAGGSNIRELITRCGGPSEARASGNTVRFPKQGDSADLVTIRGPKAVAEKIRAALASEVTSLQSRVVHGVVVAHSQHASIIGKGASALQELQKKHGVKISIPGWNDYAAAGDVHNVEDVKDAAEKDVIKILGPKEAALAAAEEILKGRPTTLSATVSVPRKQHAKLAQGGKFFRSLPSGTRVTHAGHKPPPAPKAVKPPAAPATEAPAPVAARIDDDGSEAVLEEIVFQLVPLGPVEDAGPGEIPWVIESTSQADLDKVVETIEKALGNLGGEGASHVGWLTVPKGLMPRIVGRGGSGLEKLRSVGVEVEVVGRRDANQLTIIGTPEKIEEAHRMIRQLATPSNNR